MNIYTQPITAPTFESVWASLQETREQFAEVAKIQKETDKEMRETDRQMKKLRKQLGGIGDSQGSFAEEYFFNSFKKRKKTFFGKKFDEIKLSKSVSSRKIVIFAA